MSHPRRTISLGHCEWMCSPECLRNCTHAHKDARYNVPRIRTNKALTLLPRVGGSNLTESSPAMTITDNTSPAGAALGTTHTRDHCPSRLNESFWMPSYCPVGVATATRRLDALVDATEVSWDGGRYATAHYFCACCGSTWTEDNWPAVFPFGPNWRQRHHEPVHWVAGVDVPHYVAGDPTRWPSAMAG
jgi:hypothetical protein